MAKVSSKPGDELTKAIRSIVEKALEAQTREQIAARSKEVASAIAETAENAAGRASEIAGEAWKESAPTRREAAKSARRMSREALKWSRATWRRRVGPALRDAWDGRAAALTAAGIAVPTSREIAKQAEKRLGLRRREERRWRTFFLGLVIGAIGGAIVALLTAPRPGREVRDELAQRAREAAENAGEWVPLFQRDETPAESTLATETEAIPVETPVETHVETRVESRRSKGNGVEASQAPREESGEAL